MAGIWRVSCELFVVVTALAQAVFWGAGCAGGYAVGL